MPGPNRLTALFDTDLDGLVDARGRIGLSDGRLSVFILGLGQSVEPVLVHRPSRRTVRFTLAAGSPLNPPGVLGIAARSRVEGARAGCQGSCVDRLPDTGWTSAGGSGGSDFTCTRVIGFSQTGSWFKNGFEDHVPNANWELLTRSGGAINLWAQPDYAGWAELVQSPCSSGPIDRVVLTISSLNYEEDSAWFAPFIQQTITNVLSKYLTVESIVLQPVVGGPGNGACLVAGSDGQTVVVRASHNHPLVDAAIATVVGGDVAAGASPEVSECSDYQDDDGHLTLSGARDVARTLGQFYLQFESRRSDPPVPGLDPVPGGDDDEEHATGAPAPMSLAWLIRRGVRKLVSGFLALIAATQR